jgi:hypothetical protein
VYSLFISTLCYLILCSSLQPTFIAKKSFFERYEKVEENKDGVRRERMSKPWYEIALHIMKYVTCEGKNSMIHTYHFTMRINFYNHQLDKKKMSIKLEYPLLPIIMSHKIKC